MRTFKTHKPVIAIIVSALALLVLGAFPSAARADDDDDDTAAANVEVVSKTQWGVGFRLRNVRIPKGMIELFVERAPAGISAAGFGGEIVRRKGNMELILGFEYEKLIPTGGTPDDCARDTAGCVWIDKGDMIPQDEPDLVEFDGFGWFTIDFTFAWRNQFHKMIALRYGAGIGIGIPFGDILRTDYRCTTSDPASCGVSPTAENLRAKEDGVPPVLPVINAMIGLQITPIDKVAINIEAGIRTIPYFGASATYFF